MQTKSFTSHNLLATVVAVLNIAIHPVLADSGAQEGSSTKLGVNRYESQNDNTEDAGVELTAWESWQVRSPAEICNLFNKSHKLLAMDHLTVSCQITYTVSHDGHVSDVRFVKSSGSTVFDAALLTTIRSMNGNPVLKFPPHSKRQFETETVCFSFNYGRGLSCTAMTGTIVHVPPIGSFTNPPFEEKPDESSEKITEKQAIKIAEKFINDRHTKRVGSVECGSQPFPFDIVNELLENLMRVKGSELKAYGTTANAKGEPGWTVVFKMPKVSQPTNGKVAIDREETGLAVTMDEFGHHLCFQHKDYFLKACQHKL